MPRTIAGIILAPLVEALRRAQYPIDQNPHLLYPDGSLRWEGNSNFSRSAFSLLQNAVPGAIAQCAYRPIGGLGGSPFFGTVWTLTYPGSYAWNLVRFDESGLGIGPQDGRLVAEHEKDLSHVRVLVRFYRSVKHKSVEEMAKAVSDWFAVTGRHGVLGEQGVTSLSPLLRHKGKNVSFELDAHGTGQETLNTLYLAILTWAISCDLPLAEIDLAGDPTEPVFRSELSVSLS